jgi:hypothetical protein
VTFDPLAVCVVAAGRERWNLSSASRASAAGRCTRLCCATAEPRRKNGLPRGNGDQPMCSQVKSNGTPPRHAGHWDSRHAGWAFERPCVYSRSRSL